MSEKKNISAEQAYSLIKTMVQCGAVIIANDGMSEWTVEKKDTPFEYLAMEHIVMGTTEEIYRNEDSRIENQGNAIESAYIKDNTLELNLVDGENYYLDFFAPKFMIDKIVKSDGADVTPMDIFNTFVKSAPVIMTNE